MWRFGAKVDFQLPALLVITFLANAPCLAPSVVFVHDTLNTFIFFHCAYSELFFHSEFPRWLPLIGYGIPFDFQMIACLLPTDYVTMACGWLLGVQDANLLFKISVILSQGLFVLGLYLLSGKLFQSRIVIWMVCLGGVLTNAWQFNLLLNFTVFYLLPLVLYLLLRFLETDAARFLWFAATVEAVSLLGTIPYIAPIHLLILLTFLLPYFWQRPVLIKVFLRPSNFLHPCFWLFVVLLACMGSIMFRRDAVFLSLLRDRATGKAPLDIFLADHRESLAAMLKALLLGDVASGDIVPFIGVLPLLMLGLAGRRRDPLFLGFAGPAFFLFWLSRAGWFAVACYYFLPLMNKYHQLSHLFNILKLFLLLLGGFGLDRLLHASQAPLPAVEPARAPPGRGRGWWLVTALVVGCVVDTLAHLDHNDLSQPALLLGNTSFSAAWYGRWVLLGRFVLYAGLIGWLMFRGRTGPIVPRGAGAAFLTVYLLDVGCFWLIAVIQAPYCGPRIIPGQVLLHHRTLAVTQSIWPSGLELTDQLYVRPLQYRPQRVYVSNLPRQAEEIFRVITAPRGTVPFAIYYASIYQFMDIDPLMPQARLDMILPGVKKMIEARRGEVKVSPAITLPEDDLDFQRSLGRETAKIRVVHRAVRVENEAKAVQWFSQSAGHDPYDALVITAPPPGVTVELPSLPSPDAVEVTRYRANRQVVKVWTSAPGWLFSADAYHPAWKATITASDRTCKPTEVACANVGCKAVYVPAGSSEVAFYYDDGPRNGVRELFLALASVLGFVLTAALAAVPFTQSPPVVFPVEPAPPPLTVRALPIWCRVVLAAIIVIITFVVWR